MAEGSGNVEAEGFETTMLFVQNAFLGPQSPTKQVNTPSKIVQVCSMT